jgi:hypothetical protein
MADQHMPYPVPAFVEFIINMQHRSAGNPKNRVNAFLDKRFNQDSRARIPHTLPVFVPRFTAEAHSGILRPRCFRITRPVYPFRAGAGSGFPALREPEYSEVAKIMAVLRNGKFSASPGCPVRLTITG